MSAKKARTVYLCTSGCYSDYRIYGAFSTHKKAEAYWRHHVGPDREPNWDDCWIEEHVLDEPFADKGCFYCASIGHCQEPYWEAGRVATGATVTWLADGGAIVHGDGPTAEHARRSRDEMLRAIQAGTLVHPDADAISERERERKERDAMNAELAASVAKAVAAHPEEFA